MTPNKSKLFGSPCSLTPSKNRSASRVSTSTETSSPTTPTPNGIFVRLKHQQSSFKDEITTYSAGALRVVEYPLNPRGTRVKPSLVWSILKTYNMPQLYCFHEEKAHTYPLERGLLYVAQCARKKGKCGYYVNFNHAYQNQDGAAKLYQPNSSVDAESNHVTEPINTLNVTPPSSGPVRSLKHRQSTPWVTPRSTQRSKKAQRVGSPQQELEFIPPAAYLSGNPAPSTTNLPSDYSEPPYTQVPRTSKRGIDSFYVHEVLVDLESGRGVGKDRFLAFFEECEYCYKWVRKNKHTCEIWENAFRNVEGGNGAGIGTGYEADAESSPVGVGPPRKMVVIDLTVDDSD